MTITPHGKCKVVVNGVPITAQTKLQHLVNFPARSQGSLSRTREGAQGWGWPGRGSCRLGLGGAEVPAVPLGDLKFTRCVSLGSRSLC